MIRARRLTPELLDAWLVIQPLVVRAHPSYRIRLWREHRASLAPLLQELRAYIDETFEDARRRLRHGFEDPLSPFDDPAEDPAANYPSALHRSTLQGYLGETLAVMAVEHWGAVEQNDWCVPLLLFRLHDQEFQHLEKINQRIRDGERFDRDAPGEVRPGRTGDDALAFRLGANGLITDVLTLEAKCLRQNNNASIQEAHEKLVAGGPLPPGVRELIGILSEYNGPEAALWQEALIKFRKDGYRAAARHDGVSYATAHVPLMGDRQAWLPVDGPHAAYTVARQLEGMEFQFEDLQNLVDLLYRAANHAN